MSKYIEPDDVDTPLLTQMKKKAASNSSQYHLAAAGFNKKGELLSIETNAFRRDNVGVKKYSGAHCEMRLLIRHGMKLNSIVLLRIGNRGDILPIDPCPKCRAVLNKLGIKVYPIRCVNIKSTA
jgi:cytidine deaminase